MKRNKAQATTAEDEHPKRRLLIILMFALSATIAALWWFGLLRTGPEFIVNWPDDPFTIVIKRVFTQQSPLVEVVLALLALFLSALVVIRMKFGMATVYKTALASALGATACAWVACSPDPPPTTPTKATPRIEFIDDSCCYDWSPAQPPEPDPQQQDPGQAPPAGAAGV